MGAGTSNKIVGGNNAVKDGVANVTGNAVWVRVIGAVTIAQPVTVVQPTHDLLNANATLQLQDVDVVAGGGVGISRSVRVPVTEYGTLDRPNVYWDFAALGITDVPSTVLVDIERGLQITHPIPSDPFNSTGQDHLWPAGVVRDDVLTPLLPINNDYDVLRVTSLGALWGSLVDITGDVLDILTNTQAMATGPKKSAVTNILATTTFDNVTTAANSSSFDATEFRHLAAFLDMAISGGTGGSTIRFFAQFSNDGGTSWLNYAVDQWVDLRYVVSQLDLGEVIPLNYVVPSLFRIRVVTTGTTAVDTMDVTIDVQGIT